MQGEHLRHVTDTRRLGVLVFQDTGHDDLTVVTRDEFGQYRVTVAIPFAKVFIVGSRPENVAHGIAPARRVVFE